MNYLDFLRTVHRLKAPARYLEIGIRNGVSLSLSQCRSVAIDPAYSITAEIDGDIALFRTSSDEYFARPDPLAASGGQPFDLAFIDGLHLFEFALRDFINAERHSRPNSIIIFDDVLPRSIPEAARVRDTVAWTGDVYSVVEALAHYRPELIVLPVDTRPTGLLLVLGLDPQNTVLSDKYDEVRSQYLRTDPQPVAAELMDRLNAVPPQRVLDAGIWEILSSSAGAGPAEVRSALGPVVQSQFGRGFVPAAP